MTACKWPGLDFGVSAWQVNPGLGFALPVGVSLPVGERAGASSDRLPRPATHSGWGRASGSRCRRSSTPRSAPSCRSRQRSPGP